MDDTQEKFIIESILASGVKIPPMPAVMVEFMALEGDPEAPLEKYCAILNRDTAMTGALFRVANSPVFGLRRVDNLNRALSTIGIKNAGAIVRSQSMRRALDDPRYMAFMSMLWDRLDRIAALSVKIVKQLRVPLVPTDLAYLLGIFHDAGLAVLCKRHESYARAFANFDVWPDVAALDQMHQTHHAVIGQMLARTWQLPPGLIQAIRHHHDRAALDTLPGVVGKLILVLQCAIHHLNLLQGKDDQDWEAVWRTPVMDRLGLDAGKLEELGKALHEDDD